MPKFGQTFDVPVCLWCEMGRKPTKLKRQYVHIVECVVYEDGAETRKRKLTVCPTSGAQHTAAWDGHSPREWTPRRLRSKSAA